MYNEELLEELEDEVEEFEDGNAEDLIHVILDIIRMADTKEDAIREIEKLIP